MCFTFLSFVVFFIFDVFIVFFVFHAFLLLKIRCLGRRKGGGEQGGIARGGRKCQSIFFLVFFVVCLFCLCCLFFVLCCVFCVLRPLSLLKISCGGGRGGGEHWGRWSKGGEVVNPSFCWCFLSFCLLFFSVTRRSRSDESHLLTN